MAFKCPHCSRQGITLPDKLFTSASVWTQRPAKCKYCMKAARLSGHVVQLQFIIFIIALLLVSWIIPYEFRLVTALVIAGIIVFIGILTPLKKQNI